jgi:tRNA pseudouridine13 synthase
VSILPYLTHDLPGIGGVIKQRAEDFRVEELPLRGPSGKGRYLWFRLTKRGLPTPAAAKRVAKYMGVSPEMVGFAGLKDSLAVANQWMSVGGDPDERRLAKFRDKQLRVDDIHPSSRPIQVGDLAGNRFIVRVRKAQPGRQGEARAILEALARRGVPNYFGPQRFGARGDNSQLGEALLRGDEEEFLRVFLGRPCEGDPPTSRKARAAFDRGDLGTAMAAWPHHCTDPRNALAALQRRRGREAAVAAIDPRVRQLCAQAFQSDVFNSVLAARIDSADRVLTGDLAEEAESGRIVAVVRAEADQPRAAAFRISPTGVLPGRGACLAGGEPGRIERAVLKQRGVPLEMFTAPRAVQITGSRRALRFRPSDLAAAAGRDRWGPFVELTFTLPPGCYATVLVEEVCKNRVAYTR